MTLEEVIAPTMERKKQSKERLGEKLDVAKAEMLVRMKRIGGRKDSPRSALHAHVLSLETEEMEAGDERVKRIRPLVKDMRFTVSTARQSVHNQTPVRGLTWVEFCPEIAVLDDAHGKILWEEIRDGDCFDSSLGLDRYYVQANRANRGVEIFSDLRDCGISQEVEECGFSFIVARSDFPKFDLRTYPRSEEFEDRYTVLGAFKTLQSAETFAHAFSNRKG